VTGPAALAGAYAVVLAAARRSRHMLVGVALLAFVACGPQGSREQHADWVIHSRVAFVEADLRTAREPLPRDSFRMFFPYIAGDLYGPPTTGDFIHPLINTDGTFEMDLNRTHPDLLRSLQPTEFSLEYLKIEPADARIARLAPMALQQDGIERVAAVEWVDARSDERLMLVYMDRPSRITGTLSRNGHTIRYNIQAAAPGYVWVGRRETAAGEQTYTQVQRPESVLLALTP
jgi:hypothetical protein